MQQLIKGIEALMNEEVDRATKKHGEIEKTHEAYGLLKEEVEEVGEEYKKLLQNLDNFWNDVKNDDFDFMNNKIKQIKETTIKCAAEAVQVACVAQRVSFMLEKKV